MAKGKVVSIRSIKSFVKVRDQNSPTFNLIHHLIFSPWTGFDLDVSDGYVSETIGGLGFSSRMVRTVRPERHNSDFTDQCAEFINTVHGELRNGLQLSQLVAIESNLLLECSDSSAKLWPHGKVSYCFAKIPLSH